MTLREHTPSNSRPNYSPQSDRLEALAAIWARQTGRPIVVQAAASVRTSGEPPPARWVSPVRSRVA
jgi:hypothetical protein